MLRELIGSSVIIGMLGMHSSAFAQQAAVAAELERLSLIKALQKRLLGTGPSEWQLGHDAFNNSAASVVQAIPFNSDNATNSADVLAIGKKIWDRKFKNGKSLSHCFANGGKRVAASYPQFDIRTKAVVTLEMALNHCLALHGEGEIDPANSATIGPLSAYARSLSDKQPLAVRVPSAAAKEKFDAGQALFTRRIGQHNFACASCHVLQAGELFEQVATNNRGFTQVTLSPVVGQATSWPRLTPGGTVLSLQMQFQQCMRRSGAEPFSLGSEELNNLEYFHGFLSNGLQIRTLREAPPFV